MTPQRLLLSLCLVLKLTAAATAQTITVNGEAPPSDVTVGAATSIALGVFGGPGSPTDWIALYPTGAPDSGYLSWSYLKGTAAPPSSGLSEATFTTYAPLQAGVYEWRLFANNGWTRVATSSAVTVAASPAVLTVNGVAPPTAAAAIAGSNVVVSFAGGPASATDWIGLAPAGSPDTTLVDWRYLNGTTVPPSSGLTSGTVSFLAPPTAGGYEVRLFAHGTFARLATTTINVSASSAAITVNSIAPPTAVPAYGGTYVTVGVSDGPAQPGDWIGLFAANAPDSANVAWKYLNGSTTIPTVGMPDAALSFAVPVAPGSYEFRLFNANTYTRLATSTTMVVSASTSGLTVNGTSAPNSVTATAGSQAMVGVATGPGNVGDWVGLFLMTESDTAVLDWRYLSDTAQLPAEGLNTATLHFSVPTTSGTYQFRFFADNSYNRLAVSGPVVVPATTAQISVNGTAPPTPVSVEPGSVLAVGITGGPANPTDWVALASAGSPDSSYLAWQYLSGSGSPPSSGLSSATLSFTLPSTAGTYEVLLFAHNSYQRITTSAPIVASDEPAQVSVALTSPFPGTTFNAPSSVALAATVSITGGTLSRVDFYAGASLIGSASTSPHQVNWMTPPEGVHVLTAVAVDSANAATTSAPVSITIAPAGTSDGTVGAPIATPSGGFFSQAPHVTLTAEAGALIRYTLDGSEPTASSALYTTSILIPGTGATLKARAFKAAWNDSSVLSATYIVDSVPPTITATVSPRANAAGWHNTPVTVTFACADNVSVETCPVPVTIGSDGAAHLVSAVVVDGAGNEASVSVLISLDRVAPSVILPGLPTDVATAALSFNAAVSDSTSGLVGATCNGVAAEAVTNAPGCAIILLEGRNVVLVAAADAAGNVGSASALVTLVSADVATSLAVSPESAGMIVGESRAFAVKDDRGRTVTATWESSDDDILEFVQGQAVAVAPGEVTLTATASGLTATATVAVYSGPFMAAGATRWSQPSIGGSPDLADTIVMNPFAADDPPLLSVEYTEEWRRQPLVRALDVDGTELWRGRLPIGPNEAVFQLAADVLGGVLAHVLNLDTNREAILRVGWSVEVPSWRRDLPPGAGNTSLPLQAKDGTLYGVEGTWEATEYQPDSPYFYTNHADIVSLDGRTGAVRFRQPLPSFTRFQRHAGYQFQDVYVLSALDGMTLSSEGVLYVTTTSGFTDDMFGWDWSMDTKLLRIDSAGSTTVEPLWQGAGNMSTPRRQRVGAMHADGAGGVFFQMQDFDPATPYSPVVRGSYRSATFSNDFVISGVTFQQFQGGLFPQVTSTGSEAVSWLQTGRLLSFDMRSGSVHWERETTEMATVSIDDGGAVLADGSGGYRAVDSSGAVEPVVDAGVGAGAYAFGRFHGRNGIGTLKAVVWRPINDATAYVGGRPASSGFQYGIWAKSHYVVPPLKHAAIRIIPRNQAQWLADENPWHTYFSAPKLRRYGDLAFATIGGGPSDGFGGPLAYLERRFNSDTDVNKNSVDRAERLSTGTCCEDLMIGELFNLANAFDNHTLDYELTPAASTDGFNSNSFLRGLLQAASVPLPEFPFAYLGDLFPGWNKPVPALYFGVQP